MDSPTYEVGSKEELLAYLQTNGIAVIVWNEAGAGVCRNCRFAAGAQVSSAHEAGMPEGVRAADGEACADAAGGQGFAHGQGSDKRAAALREQITEKLVLMGFRQGQTGFNNIVEAITEIAQMERGQQIRVTSDIYPRVAARQHSTVRNVERSIRNAIESVWKRSNLQTLQEMYPYPCDNLNGRPTNAEFLINMAGRMRNNAKALVQTGL